MPFTLMPLTGPDGTTIVGRIEVDEQVEEFLKKDFLILSSVMDASTQKIVGYILQPAPQLELLDTSNEETYEWNHVITHQDLLSQSWDLRVVDPSHYLLSQKGYLIPTDWDLRVGDQIILRRKVNDATL